MLSYALNYASHGRATQKIVERREQREREQAELQAHREERFKQFEEWRRQQEEADKKPRLV